MPNWCNTFIEFFGDGTPAGLAAIKDLHDRIMKTQELMKQMKNSKYNWCEMWEVDLARFGYGVDINAYQRGYFTYVSDVDEEYQVIKIECDDAWSPNVVFWDALIKHFYGNHITFFFQASEPGCCVYETNDPGILPRYNISVYAEGIDELLDYDKLWEYDNVFANLVNNPEVSFNHNPWHKRVLDEIDPATGYHKMIDEYSSPAPLLLIDEEGDEDYVLECIEEYKTLDDEATIDNIHDYFKHNTLTVNPWEYISLEELYNDDSACANVCANMGNPDDYVVKIKRDYAEVTDIKDNFTQSMSYEEFMKGVQNNG